jgi:hypothetical protein
VSLISEALRRARAEQQRREIERGAAPPPLPLAPPRPPSSPLPWVLAASLLSALLAAAGVWLLLPGPPHPVPAPASPKEAPPAAAQQSAPSTPTAPSQPPVPRSLPAASSPELPEAPASPPPATPAPQPTAPSAATAPGVQEFVVEGKVAGVTLHLDFLVYGASRSFASINGQEVRVGSTVEGFVVEEIREDRVLLRGQAESVVLKVR